MSNFEDFLWEMYNEGLRDVVLDRVTKLRKLDKYEHLDFKDVIGGGTSITEFWH